MSFNTSSLSMDLSPEVKKRCSKCKKRKVLSEFSKDRSYKDGIRGACKPCEKERHKTWSEAHREHLTEYQKNWLKTHPGKTKEYQEKMFKKYPEKIRAHNHNRLAKKRNARGKIDADQRKLLIELQQGRCIACKQKFVIIGVDKGWRFGHPQEPTLDHIRPLGPGAHELENVQMLCRSCNSSKGTKTVDYRSKTLKKKIFKQQTLF